jgi:methylenetetrahydrofolate--tRNA-(uracil-5-)-methyltransferase
MRPGKTTPAHHGESFAELVCSNSFRAESLDNAVGLLKEEMRRLDSLIMRCADAWRVPAGAALAVDREGFAGAVTQALIAHPLVEVIREEAARIPGPEQGIVILATGPLTSPSMAEALKSLTGEDSLYFYDAAAPLIQADSVDMSMVYWASRYGKGTRDYLNCPMSREEYEAFHEALIRAELAPVEGFDREAYFEGCMPAEVLAKRGPRTLLFGPMKPVGLEHPVTGKRPWAVVQLRQDDRLCALFNMVGFQTRLKWSEQKRVFRMIPGLAQAEFARYGVMHRNTFINAPRLMEETGRLRRHPHIFMAGQMTGVEGYVESAASGLLAGLNAARMFRGRPPAVLPEETAMGSLIRYIVRADPEGFQPMNVTFGLMPPLTDNPRDKKARRRLMSERALEAVARWAERGAACC